MSARLDRLWQSDRLHSSEHLTYRSSPSGHRFDGTAVLLRHGQPTTIVWSIEIDPTWRCSNAHVTVSGASDEDLRIAVDHDQHWTMNGQHLVELDACIDLDLGWTPATNTLPIRRLELNVGNTTSIEAAWLRYPDLDLVRSTQTYQRLDHTRWRYSSGNFSADLDVTPDGIVTTYGDIWRAIEDG